MASAPSARGLARQRKILEVAAQLFSQSGYAAVGVDEIGRRAGMTGPGIYRHFAGKDEILATLLEQVLDGIVSATGGRDEDPWVDLRRIAEGHTGYLLAERRLAGVWIYDQRSLSQTYRRRLRLRQAAYVDTVRGCLSRCLPGWSEEDVRSVTHMALGILNSVVGWPPSEPERERRMAAATAGTVVDLVRGLRDGSFAPPAPASA
ncbi:TetR/AcrR family transcriptional regulator [Conexibacter sp. SYSU D00693]|uniref:TetR/AcrR family transcriptional regulator n=1 Tax=Conexibacter sp. SYSU D00693 TaxID=2812560 RepID=UPI00196AF623|nr:TetR/AcrR family transcriptional regulator [Conexibacter sp. SYSU D00693]